MTQDIILVTEKDGSFTYELPNKLSFTMPALGSETARDKARDFIDPVLTELVELSACDERLRADRSLSDFGREERLEPKRGSLVERVSAASVAVEVYEKELQEREDKLTAVPKLDQVHAVMAIEDREIRDWWRAVPADKRPQLTDQLANEPSNERIVVALLRSPVGGIDIELKYFSEVWKRNKRLGNPAEALAIDDGRAAVEWARRGLAQAAARTQMTIGRERWNNERIAGQLLDSKNEYSKKGFEVFAISDRDMAMAAAKRNQRLGLRS